MRGFLIAIAVAVMLLHSSDARADLLDRISARLEALEQENAALKARVRQLEERAAMNAASLPDAAARRTGTASAHIAPASSASEGSGHNVALAALQAPSRDRWDRTYVGLQGGYSAGEPTYPFLGANFPGETFSGELEGKSFGVQAGQSWQSGALVLGLDLQARHEDIRSEAQGVSEYDVVRGGDLYSYTAVGLATTTVNWTAAAKGRIGLASPSTLLYATGGVTAAQVDEEYDSVSIESVLAIGPGGTGTGGLAVTDSALRSTSSIQVGLIAGMGFEYALTDNLSLAAEYEYYWLGDRSFAPTGAETALDWHSMSARLNWSF